MMFPRAQRGSYGKLSNAMILTLFCAGGLCGEFCAYLQSELGKKPTLIQPVMSESSSPRYAASDDAVAAPVRQHSIEISGVQPYALDQPRVPAFLQSRNDGRPLSVYVEEAGQYVFAIDAFLDTGSSRIALSKADRVALKVQSTGQTVHDIGIGGQEIFDVSIPYHLRVGDSGTNTGDLRQFHYGMDCVLQLRQKDQNMLEALPPSLSQIFSREMDELDMGAEDVGEMFGSSVNIIGTPLIQNYVVILDPRPVVTALQSIAGEMAGGGADNDVLDKMIEDAEKTGTDGSNFGRIKVDLMAPTSVVRAAALSIPLVMRDMDPGQQPVTKANVPFVGVTLSNGGRSCRGEFLLDTGGGVSLLSPRLARVLGLNLEHPQFSANVQGVGQGGGGLSGYWVERLALSSGAGSSVTYRQVPLFVADIAGIDGSIGMNLLGPSVYLNLGNLDMSNPMQILGDMRPGPLLFSRVVIDIPHKRLGLDPA